MDFDDVASGGKPAYVYGVLKGVHPLFEDLFAGDVEYLNLFYCVVAEYFDVVFRRVWEKVAHFFYFDLAQCSLRFWNHDDGNHGYVDVAVQFIDGVVLKQKPLPVMSQVFGVLELAERDRVAHMFECLVVWFAERAVLQIGVEEGRQNAGEDGVEVVSDCKNTAICLDGIS